MARDATPAPWTVAGEEKQAYVRRLFADISPTYDLMNSAMSLRLHHRWRAFAVGLLDLKPGDAAADICCGTGDFARPLRRAVGPSGRIVGVDFCRPMLERGRKKGMRLQPALGDACRLPLRSASVECVTVGWGLRNVSDLSVALREIYRVLKPGGRFVTVDMAVPRSAAVRAAGGLLFHRLVPLLGGLFGKREAYAYLPKSTDRFATREALADALAAAGFENVHWHDLFFGNICVHRGDK